MIRLLTGDCREVLRGLPDESVHCVVTSPPYYGLRDYGTATWEGGDDPNCDHDQRRMERHQDSKSASDAGAARDSLAGRDVCRKCGARRIDNQIGLEASPSAYIANLVAVFAEVKRVLHPSGCVFLNLGDSYAGAGYSNHHTAFGDGAHRVSRQDGSRGSDVPPGLKPKDLMMIPARVAIALQDDGWWIRSEIVWAKRAPMPESVTDRCTRSHEMVYMLAKRANYYADMEAVKEPNADPERTNFNPGKQVFSEGMKAASGDQHRGFGRTGKTPEEYIGAGHNLRDVWLLGPEPFKGSHFAVFPTELARRCIAMGTSERGVCSMCGAPWERVVERTQIKRPRPNGGTRPYLRVGGDDLRPMPNDLQGVDTTTTGWRPTCECYPRVAEWREIPGREKGESDEVYQERIAPVLALRRELLAFWEPFMKDNRPCVCLDPFGGSGTVGLVADRLGRDAILIDLNPEYSEMQRARVTADAPLFAEVMA